ncbi:MAG: hypothetical protein HQK77_15400 [Desulfobacterales bacterium]|nr:hypothetical protein [Desulfobacterales bacterium]
MKNNKYMAIWIMIFILSLCNFTCLVFAIEDIDSQNISGTCSCVVSKSIYLNLGIFSIGKSEGENLPFKIFSKNDMSFIILSGQGPYQIISKNPRVANAVLNGSTINVTASGQGSTTICIADNQGYCLDIHVEVGNYIYFYVVDPTLSAYETLIGIESMQEGNFPNPIMAIQMMTDLYHQFSIYGWDLSGGMLHVPEYCDCLPTYILETLSETEKLWYETNRIQYTQFAFFVSDLMEKNKFDVWVYSGDKKQLLYCLLKGDL